MNGSRSILIRGGTVVPMTSRRAWSSGDVLIEGDRIVAVGPGLVPDAGAEVLDATDSLVLPGFVQAHVHVVQSLARHRAEGLALLEWLQQRIWPYEAALTEEEVYAAARLGIAELLSGGTTAALDMGTTHSQRAVFQAAEEMGIRLTSGKCHMNLGDGAPARLIEDADDSLAEAEALGTRWHGAAGGRLRYAVAPRFVLSCTPQLLSGTVELARRHGWLMHTHAAENRRECELVREMTGVGNVAYLAHVGISGPRTVLAHCVHLDDDEVALLAAGSTGVAHCPGANLKLASGIADLPALLRQGVRVGIGADGPPCNNRLSIFHEMALAGTLHNLAGGAGAVDAWTVLELATWRGAEVLGLTETGRLQAGWRADIVILDRGWWSMEPASDPAASIVFGGGAGAVRHVLVDGEVRVRDAMLLSADARAIRADARRAADAVASRLGWT